MTFCAEFAGVSVEVNHKYEYIRNICHDYMTDIPPAFSVSVTDEEILEEVNAAEGMYPERICESTAIHRKIVIGLVKYGIVLMHSAVIAVDGIAYVFMAKSGVGKSTHINLWREVYGERAMVVNGDKPFFSFEGDVLMVHGSPWMGKEQIGNNISMPVGGICLLERAEHNSIEPAVSKEIFDKIIHQVLFPDNAEDMDVFMNFMSHIIRAIPFYRLKCNMDRQAAIVAYEGMRKEAK